jgi:hypothetical protein
MNVWWWSSIYIGQPHCGTSAQHTAAAHKNQVVVTLYNDANDDDMEEAYLRNPHVWLQQLFWTLLQWLTICGQGKGSFYCF